MMHRDRTGELVDEVPTSRHDCTRGWVGEDHDGRPVPCFICKPYLTRRRCTEWYGVCSCPEHRPLVREAVGA
jgi:hypothetical protein